MRLFIAAIMVFSLVVCFPQVVIPVIKFVGPIVLALAGFLFGELLTDRLAEE